MENIKCDWLRADAPPTDNKRALAFHQEHGFNNLQQCDSWRCQCGNTPDGAGFFPCNRKGQEVEPLANTRYFLQCDNCKTIYHRNGLVMNDDIQDDHDLILAIQDLLDGLDWNSDTAGDIATLLQNAGYTVRDPND